MRVSTDILTIGLKRQEASRFSLSYALRNPGKVFRLAKTVRIFRCGNLPIAVAATLARAWTVAHEEITTKYLETF